MGVDEELGARSGKRREACWLWAAASMRLHHPSTVSTFSETCVGQKTRRACTYAHTHRTRPLYPPPRVGYLQHVGAPAPAPHPLPGWRSPPQRTVPQPGSVAAEPRLQPYRATLTVQRRRVAYRAHRIWLPAQRAAPAARVRLKSGQALPVEQVRAAEHDLLLAAERLGADGAGTVKVAPHGAALQRVLPLGGRQRRRSAERAQVSRLISTRRGKEAFTCLLSTQHKMLVTDTNLLGRGRRQRQPAAEMLLQRCLEEGGNS